MTINSGPPQFPFSNTFWLQNEKFSECEFIGQPDITMTMLGKTHCPNAKGLGFPTKDKFEVCNTDGGGSVGLTSMRADEDNCWVSWIATGPVKCA